MQTTLLCATCATPLAFKVPELTGNRWHTQCESCGARTALQALPTKPEELATFNAVGIYSSR
jgi:hypothetical protein